MVCARLRSLVPAPTIGISFLRVARSSSATAQRPVIVSRARWVSLKAFVLAAIVVLAIFFVVTYVFPYYFHYNPAGFRHYWPKRATLLVHISAGMVALLTGPTQFSQRLRQRHLPIHRILGRIYLCAIALGSLAAFRLALTTSDGWAWGFGVAMLGVAWVVTSGMAFYAILQRQVAVHKEWMVRSYVVTFGFVIFRALNDMGPTSRLMPAGDRAVTYIWACWTVPLLAADVILQLRRMRAAPRSQSPS